MMSMFCRFLAASSLMTAMAVGQIWTCPDDGASPTIVANTGTGNESYVFAVTPETGYDNTLEIEVFDLHEPTRIIVTLVLTEGTTPTVTVGPDQGVRIKDPSDDDSLGGKGSYRAV